MYEVMEDECFGCGICVQSCPQGAITIKNDRAEINQELCKSCGECVKVCGSQAIINTIPQTCTKS